MSLRRVPAFCLPFALLAWPAASAQDAGREVVVPTENVRYDYAQVLAVNKVYQVLRTSGNERVCDARLPALASAARSTRPARGDDTTDEERRAGLRNCRNEPVTKEFQRVIAYDVDYAYRGSKFRTRMGRDPGNRLRVRVSITPHPFD